MLMYTAENTEMPAAELQKLNSAVQLVMADHPGVTVSEIDAAMATCPALDGLTEQELAALLLSKIK